MHGLILLVAAAGDNPTTDPLAILLAYGPLGVVVAAFMFGWLHPNSTVKRLEDQLRQKDEIISVKDTQISTLQDGIVKDALPALIKSNALLEDFPTLERRLSDNFQRLETEMGRLGGKMERG